MNLNDYFICPHCGSKEISLLFAKPLMSDIREDLLACTACAARWKVYCKVAEVVKEMIYVPEKASESTEDVI